jgi:hypothetical protein
MAIYTPLAKKDAIKIADEFTLGDLLSFTGIKNGSVNTHYLLETKRGRFFAKSKVNWKLSRNLTYFST